MAVMKRPTSHRVARFALPGPLSLSVCVCARACVCVVSSPLLLCPFLVSAPLLSSAFLFSGFPLLHFVFILSDILLFFCFFPPPSSRQILSLNAIRRTTAHLPRIGGGQGELEDWSASLDLAKASCRLLPQSSYPVSCIIGFPSRSRSRLQMVYLIMPPQCYQRLVHCNAAVIAWPHETLVLKKTSLTA